MDPVGEREPFVAGAGEVLREIGAVTAGLLIGPLAGEVRRHVDLVHERDRRQRVGDGRAVMGIRSDLAEQVGRLTVQHLVALAGLIAGLDLLERPRLAAGGRGGLGVVLALLAPRDREAGVEDPARVQRRRGVVDRRQRRDRVKVRRVGRGDEQLADRAVGDSQHPDLVVEHPRLMRHGLDHVIAIEALERLEVVKRAARASGPAHVDVDDGEPEQVRDLADAALGTGRVGVSITRVLDQRRIRAGPRRQADVDRELGPVPGGQVAVTAARDRLVIDLGARRCRAVAEHAQLRGAHAALAHPVAACRA